MSAVHMDVQTEKHPARVGLLGTEKSACGFGCVQQLPEIAMYYDGWDDYTDLCSRCFVEPAEYRFSKPEVLEGDEWLILSYSFLPEEVY